MLQARPATLGIHPLNYGGRAGAASLENKRLIKWRGRVVRAPAIAVTAERICFGI